MQLQEVVSNLFRLCGVHAHVYDRQLCSWLYMVVMCRRVVWWVSSSVCEVWTCWEYCVGWGDSQNGNYVCCGGGDVVCVCWDGGVCDAIVHCEVVVNVVCDL